MLSPEDTRRLKDLYEDLDTCKDEINRYIERLIHYHSTYPDSPSRKESLTYTLNKIDGELDQIQYLASLTGDVVRKSKL